MSSDAERAEWDETYAEHDTQLWSGKPNGSVVVEVSKLTPGRAPDVGCGEGADALWLAKQGWEVTGVDISSVAIDRAVAQAERVEAAVSFRAADMLADPPPARSFELVTISYPAFKRDPGLNACPRIVDAVAPGGHLLVVGHVLDDASRARAHEHGFDPDDYVSIDNLRSMVEADFTIEVDEERDRPDPPPDNHHMADRVLLAVRSSV